MPDVDIAALQARVAQLEAGQASGTTLASFEGGNFGYQMVDSVYPARCRFLIPTRTVRINKALLHFSLQPFRSGTPTAASGGGGSHNHQLAHQTSVYVEPLPGAHEHPGADFQFRHSDSSAVTLNVAGLSGHPDVAGDLYTWDTSATHIHVIPAPTALYETGMAQGCHVYIDSVDVTASLGGPWGAGAALDVHDLDVSQWLSAKGWHEVQISSTSIGGIFPSLAIFAVVGV